MFREISKLHESGPRLFSNTGSSCSSARIDAWSCFRIEVYPILCPRYGGLFREGREPHKEPSILDFQERTTNLHLETSCPCPSILLVVFERGLAVGHLTREGCEWGKLGTPSIVGEEIGRVIIIIVITRSRPIPFVKWLHSRPYYDGCEMPQRGTTEWKGKASVPPLRNKWNVRRPALPKELSFMLMNYLPALSKNMLELPKPSKSSLVGSHADAQVGIEKGAGKCIEASWKTHFEMQKWIREKELNLPSEHVQRLIHRSCIIVSTGEDDEKFVHPHTIAIPSPPQKTKR